LIYGILGAKTSLRLYSKLILFIFVTRRFPNHGLGLVSIDAMVARIKYLFRPVAHHHWLNAIYGGLFSSYNASTNMFVVTAQFPHVRLSPREVKQIYLELTAPLILAAHILGTRFPGEG
jgi:hypothetical protein